VLEYANLPDSTPQRHAATILEIKLSHYVSHEQTVWSGNLRERDNLKNLDLYSRIILKWIFK